MHFASHFFSSLLVSKFAGSAILVLIGSAICNGQVESCRQPQVIRAVAPPFIPFRENEATSASVD
jgi:hypothetical protein